MDVALFAALAVVGGFVPLRKLVWLRYQAAREETQRLYYRAAIIGFWLAVMGWFLNGMLLAKSETYRVEATKLSNALLVPLLDKLPESAPSALSNDVLPDLVRHRSRVRG